MKPIAITGQLVDVRNISTHKCARLLIDVPAEQAASIISAFGWPTMVSPVPVAIARLANPPAVEASPHGDQEGDVDRQSAGAPPPLQPEAPKAKQSWGELSCSQQAGIRCGDPIFRKWLEEAITRRPVNNETEAAEVIRHFCNIQSRGDLNRDKGAASTWRILDRRYEAWKIADRIGA